MPKLKKKDRGAGTSSQSLGSRIRRKSGRRRESSTELSSSVQSKKSDVDHRSPLRDNTNFTESTPKAVPAVVKPQDLYEMEWGEAPPLSPIERNLWSPEPSPDPSLPPSSQEQLPSSQEQPHPYYIAPEVKYDMPLRPHRRKKKKKEETKQQAELETWMKRMNEEFAEIDKHELVVVRDKR